MASVIPEFVTSGLDYNNSMCFETQCGNCTPAPAGWKWGTTAYFMASVAKGISGLCSSLSHGSQPVSDASLRPWFYFSKQLVSQVPSTSKSEFSSTNPHGICEPSRGLKAQNKASRRAVKKIRWVLSIAVDIRQVQTLVHFRHISLRWIYLLT